MPDLRNILQSILALYGFAASPRHSRRPPTLIGPPDARRIRGLSRS